MSKYNTKAVGTKTENLAGGAAFQETAQLEFVSLLLTSFLKDTFYRDEDETVARVKTLIKAIPDKRFVAKAAIFARKEFGMRSVSHLVARELAREDVSNEGSFGGWKKDFFDKIIHRPDDMLEILACYWHDAKKRIIPHAVRKGFAAALSRFNDYSLAKYKAETRDTTMIDLVNLVRPKPTPTITKLMTGLLKPAETWEVEISATKGNAKLKAEAWRKLIVERKLGYFALLRNLRNILEQAPGITEEACKMLVDEKLIKKSLVLPFRFQTAYNEIKRTNYNGARSVLRALNKAVDISCANVPKFEGKTLVVLDTSGSMSGKPSEIGSLFSAILIKSNDADFMTFSDHAEYHTINPDDSTLTIAENMVFRSGGTNFHAIFEEANKKYDRIVILSDMQGWMGYECPTEEYKRYKKLTGATPKIYSFDLAGYGTLQFPENDVFCLAGFSDKVFDIMRYCETDRNILLQKINEIKL